MVNKIKNYTIENQKITIVYDLDILNVEILTEEIINVHTFIDVYNIEPTSKMIKTEFNVEFNDTLNIYVGKYKYVFKENHLFDVYKNNELISLGIKPSTKQKIDINKELLEKEGHKVNEEENEKPIVFSRKLNDGDFIYAMGERMSFLNKRGYYYENWNTDDPSAQNENYFSLYKSIPFYINFNKNYQFGVFFDNHYHTYFDLGKSINDELKIEADGGAYNIYFINGDSLKDIVSNYTYITGVTELPQYFTLGYQQCRWSYASKDEVMLLAKRFRSENIKCDVIHLDIDYMDHYKVFTTNEATFPNFKEFVDELHSLGFKLVCIVDPGIKVEEGYDTYENLIKNKMVATRNGEVYINEVWPGDAVYPTFNDERTREFWGNELKKLIDFGVDGIWNDMNEPASFKGPLPLDVNFNGYNHDKIHNLYGYFMSMATYDGLRKNTNKRPYVITRACYAGCQKYSTIWTGDNQSLWHHLRMNLSQLTSLGLSGMSFVGSDIGGFGGDCNKELMARYIEAGCIYPLFRNHSAMGTRRQEPWTFDDELTTIYKKYVNLRYSLIPYIYDLYYQTSKSGLPLLRPIVLEYQDDENTFEINDEVMLGENILSAPIVDKGITKRLVYLPKHNWYNYFTNELYTKGYHIIDAPLDTLPLFVKEGSIIPTANFESNTKKLDEITFNIYPGKSEYIHYQDDGESYDYTKGIYNLYKISHIDNEITIALIHNGYKTYSKIILNYNGKKLEITDYNNTYKI